MRADVKDYEKLVYLSEPSFDADSGILSWQERCWQDDGYQRERYILSASGMKEKTPDQTLCALADLTDAKVKEYAFSPDGARIAYITAKDKEPEVVPGNWKAPITAEGGSYRRDSDGGWKIKRTWKLNVCDSDFRKPVSVYESTEAIHALCWMSDGSRLIFEEEKAGSVFYTVDLDGKKVCLAENIYAALGGAEACCLPDGKTILAAGIHGADSIVGYDLFALSADGSGVRKTIWDGEVPDEVFPQIINGSPFSENNHRICLTDKTDTVALIGCKAGEIALYLLTLREEEDALHGCWKRLTDGTGCFFAICKGEAGYLYAIRSDWNHPASLVKVSLSDGTFTVVYDANAWILEKALAQTTNFKCSTLDGSSCLDGWILEPADRTEVKIPAVLLVHGGPLAAYADTFTMEAQVLAAAGLGVILVNPRGSSGYGKAYASYEKAFDGTAAADLLYYMDSVLRAYPWIDENRLGVAGGSYGGYMSAWLAGHCKRFKTAVVMRGLLNFEFLYLTSQAAGNPGMYDEPTSFEDLLMKTTLESPNTYAQEMDLPMLIMHGENDVNCPLYGAHQLYVAVKDNHPDQPVRFIIFPGVGHNIRAARIDYFERYETELVNWLKKYL